MHRASFPIDTVHVLHLPRAVVAHASDVGIRQFEPDHIWTAVLWCAVDQDGRFCTMEVVHGFVFFADEIMAELTFRSDNRSHHNPVRCCGLALVSRQPSSRPLSYTRRPG